jgi:hypothetical protein
VLGTGDSHNALELRCLLLRLAREVRHPGFASDMLLELIASQLAMYECGRAKRRKFDTRATTSSKRGP